MTDQRVPLAVVGAHLRGEPLNGQLTSRGAGLLTVTTTAACYRLFVLPGSVPPKPGLVRVRDGGVPVETEVWDVPVAQLGSFLLGVPSPLAIGTVELSDGSLVHGFVCEQYAVDSAEDISRYGGWRAYLADRAARGGA